MNVLVDTQGKMIKLYKEIIPVLSLIWENFIQITVAANTTENIEVEQIMLLLEWNKYFDNKQIFPDSLEAHLNRQVKIAAYVIITTWSQVVIINDCFSFSIFQNKPKVQSQLR